MSPLSLYVVNLVDSLRRAKHNVSIFKIGMTITIAVIVTFIITLIIIGQSYLD